MKKILRLIMSSVLFVMLTCSIVFSEGYFTSANLNCRTLPSMFGNIITTFPKGTEVSILGTSGNWLKVQNGDVQGWCYNKYIKNSVMENAVQTNNTTVETQNNSQTGNMTYVGNFKLTGYCPCKQCSGGWGTRTASGATPKEGVTVAASKQFAFGTKLYIEGVGYRTVQDRGGAIKGNKLDVYVSSHSACYNANINRTAKVYIVK